MLVNKWELLAFLLDTGIYDISEEGIIISYKYKTPRFLAIRYGKGYANARLCYMCIHITFGVHQIQYFKHYRLPSTRENPIDHIDRNRLNNHISNLRQVTAQENRENTDSVANGKNISKAKKGKSIDKLKGSNNPGARLSNEDVQQIRKFLELHYTYESIAQMFKVCPQSISNIHNKVTWKGLSDEAK